MFATPEIIFPKEQHMMFDYEKYLFIFSFINFSCFITGSLTLVSYEIDILLVLLFS